MKLVSGGRREVLCGALGCSTLLWCQLNVWTPPQHPGVITYSSTRPYHLKHKAFCWAVSIELTNTHACMHAHTHMYIYRLMATQTHANNQIPHIHTQTRKYTNIHMCVHISMHTPARANTHRHTHKRTHTYMHTRSYTHRCTHACTCTHTYIETNTHTRTHVHTYTHTHTHTHTHKHTHTVAFCNLFHLPYVLIYHKKNTY